MRILVTGTAGFIGAALAQQLLARGDEVFGIDNHNHYYDPALKEARLAQFADHPRYTHLRADIADDSALRDAFARFKPQRVVHLAAQAGVRYSLENPHAYVQSNLVGFVNMLEACRHHAVEHLMAHTYSHLYNLPTTGLRFFTVYGPWGRPDMSPMLFAGRISRGEAIDVFNHGQHSRDFTYIDDIVQGVMRALDHVAAADPAHDPLQPRLGRSAAPYRIYNIGNDQPVQLLRFIELMEQHLGRAVEKRLLPMQPGDVPDTWADVSALRQDVGYAPDTPIEEGVKRFAEWFKSYKCG